MYSVPRIDRMKFDKKKPTPYKAPNRQSKLMCRGGIDSIHSKIFKLNLSRPLMRKICARRLENYLHNLLYSDLGDPMLRLTTPNLGD